MTRTDDSFTRADLELLHRALSYRRKRIHDSAAAVRVQGLLDRVEQLVLTPANTGTALRLSPPEQEVLQREIPLFCEVLTGRGASAEGAREARRLRELLHLLAAGGSPQRRWAASWRRLLGR